MKILCLAAIVALAVPVAPALAENFDCSLFRNTQAQFSCYENVSRAPKEDPQQAAKPVTKSKAVVARDRKPQSN
jgi:hypothetical protein